MERMSIFRLFRCWLRDFGSFGTFFIGNENAGGSGICIHRDLLSVEAIATDLVTCHGRNHLVNIQSGGHNLVIVNVHFEPELTLRQLRDRLRLNNPHWPSYPNGVGIILGDFNICEPEEGRFNVWNQTFTDGDPRKTAMFHSFFLPHVLEIAQPDYTRRDSTALGIIRTLSRIDRIFINLPVAEARDFHCYSHVFENLGTGPFRVITQQYVLSLKGQQIGDNRANAFQVGCPNIPFFALLQRLHDDHRFSTDPFSRLSQLQLQLLQTSTTSTSTTSTSTSTNYNFNFFNSNFNFNFNNFNFNYFNFNFFN